MRRCIPLLLLLIALPISAQTALPPGSTVLQAGTQLVVVDVVVEDKSGKPVHGLKAEDFALTEGKVPQTIRHFEEHSTLNPPPAGPMLPKMPAGTYTNYTPVAPTGTLNVLLLDALNTPMKDQSFVRNQLQEYVRHADPGTRIAIFGLATDLILLQGFTSDPDVLKNVVDHKLIPRASHLLDDPVSGDAVDQPSDGLDTSAPGMAELAANMQQFEAEMAAAQVQMRAQYTLDAFNSLAHYLAALPGRKNLIWFSGSFPLNVLPDASLTDPFAVLQLDEQEFRETTNLLTKAQVAVYPVDARGLMTLPAFSASNAGANYARNPRAFGAAVQKFGNSQAAEHATMNDMAEQTGGKAFYNTNGLAQAVAQAVSEGSNYYTLTYTPTNRKHDGGYREIRVTLKTPQPSNLQLAYRHGYYDDSPTSKLSSQPESTSSASSNLSSRPESESSASPKLSSQPESASSASSKLSSQPESASSASSKLSSQPESASSASSKLSSRPESASSADVAERPAASTATTTDSATTSLRSGAAYARAAMARGAPTPEDILFKVRVLPASTAAETTPAKDNVLDPLTPAKGPFHRFDVDYAALSNALTTTRQPDGTRIAAIAFLIHVYDRNGRLLNTTGREFKLTLKPDTYQAFLKSPIQCHMEISVPDRAETYLRIGVQDVLANRFGVVEVPTADVAHLPPPVYADAPSTSPAPSPAPSKQPTPATTPPR